jgi:acyl carrier protein
VSESIEAQVEQAWCRVLSVDECDDVDNFFGEGGDSLVALELVQQLEEALGREVPIEVLFIDGTLGGLKRAALGLPWQAAEEGS